MVTVDGLAYFFHNGEYGSYIRGIFNRGNFNKVPISILKDISISFKYKSTIIEEKSININRNIKYINEKIDIFHCLNNGFYLNKNAKKNIISISSILPLINKDLVNLTYLNRWNSRFKIALEKADYILTSSQFQKNMLVKKYNLNENKLIVLLPIIKDYFHDKNTNIARIYLKSKYKLNTDYILFLGDIHRRKNLEEVLYFFKILKDQIPSLDIKLVLGLKNIHSNEYEKVYISELKELSNILGIKEDVLFLNNPSSTDELNLFTCAKKFIDFSIYEDINISILKAFVADIDIICTKIELYQEYLKEYPFYYDFNEDNISNMYLSKRINTENFDYLRDIYKENNSIDTLEKLYNILEEEVSIYANT